MASLASQLKLSNCVPNSQSHIPYYLRLRSEPTPSMARNLVHLRVETVTSMPRRLCRPPGLHLRDTLAPAACFCDERILRSSTGPIQAKLQSEALRSLLCASADDPFVFRGSKGLVLHILAEFTLLMLSTKWLSGLCSCTIIRHICQQKDSPAYSFRAGKATSRAGDRLCSGRL